MKIIPGVTVFIAIAVAYAGSPQQPAAGRAPATQNNGATYVGTEACRTCHEDIVTNFEKSPHDLLNTNKRRGWEGRACEACHGPGSKHVESTSPEDIIRPTHLTAAKADGICLTCHLNQETQVGRLESGHAHSQVACTQCHSIHGAEVQAGMRPQQLLPGNATAATLETSRTLVSRTPAAINHLCAGCHTSEMAQFYRPYAHRVSQGAMSCVDCHNPHGAFLSGNREMFAANEPGCFRCHSEFRGPFPFEHAAIKLEGCMGCHEPHGSVNPKLLRRHLVRLVCLECHANVNPSASVLASNPSHLGGVPPSFHNLAEPTFQNCTVCHTKVHGSYVDRYLER